MSSDRPNWDVIGVALTIVGIFATIILGILGISDPTKLKIGGVVGFITFIALIVIFFRFRRREPEKIEVNFHVADTKTSLPVAEAKIVIGGLDETIQLPTNSNGDQKHFFRATEKGRIYIISVTRDHYYTYKIQEVVGEKRNITIELNPSPDHEQHPSNKLQQDIIQNVPLAEKRVEAEPHLSSKNQQIDFDISEEKIKLQRIIDRIQLLAYELQDMECNQNNYEKISSLKEEISIFIKNIAPISEKPFASNISDMIDKLVKGLMKANYRLNCAKDDFDRIKVIEEQKEIKSEDEVRIIRRRDDWNNSLLYFNNELLDLFRDYKRTVGDI